MTPNEFLKVIQDSINKKYEPVPNGWYSANDLRKIWSKSISQTNKKLRDGIELGLVEKKYYFVKTKNNSMHKEAYYRFHEKENSQKNNKRKVMENSIRSCGKNKRSR